VNRDFFVILRGSHEAGRHGGGQEAGKKSRKSRRVTKNNREKRYKTGKKSRCPGKNHQKTGGQERGGGKNHREAGGP
jgi:hypothetical protein